jgi:acetylornithine deacetylase
MLVATARTAAEGHLARGVIMAAAADEEYLFRGASALVASGLDAQEAVVGEPTNLAVVRCHRGAVRWRLAVRGRAAHGSTPQQGENAIYKMARVLAALQEYAAELAKHATDPLLGGPSLSVGAIRGGELPNVVPDYCEILIDRRSMPGESFGEIEADLRHFLLERLGPDFAFSLETLLQDPPLAPGANEALAQRAAAVVRAVTGTATITAAPYSSDASKFASAGLSAIVLGPGDVAQAHAAEEWVDVEQVRQATEIYYRLLTEP